MYLELLKKCLTASLYDESGWRNVYLQNGNQTLELPPNLIVLDKVPLDPASREVGRDWPLFGFSMVGIKRLENIRFCIDEILKNNIPGDLMEAGVWRGGSTIWMRAILKVNGITNRTVWAADSFEGLPPKSLLDQNNSDPDLSQVAYLKVSLEEVKKNFDRFDLLDEQVQFIKGWFKNSLPHAPIKKLALLRLDGDMYESTRDALQNLYDKVSPGGFVIIDDYNSWQGCRKAVNEFRHARNITADLKVIDWTGVYWQVP